jgi:hypothetical protein
MSDAVAPVRAFIRTRSVRFWLLTAIAALTLGALPTLLPASAFAGDAPQIISGSVSTTSKATLTVTLTCPSGKTPVGVAAELGGSASATINQLAPQPDRRAVARAIRVGSGSQAWSLSAKALCVRSTVDIEYVSRSKTADSGSGGTALVAVCNRGKELIGFGWSVDGPGRVASVAPLFSAGGGNPGTGGPPGTGVPGTGYPGTGMPGTGMPGTGMPGTGMPGTGMPGTGMPGTGMPGTGTGGGSSRNAFGVAISSYLPAGNTGAHWTESVVAVCATAGHATEGDSSTQPEPGSGALIAQCSPFKHVNALGFALVPTGPKGQLLRKLQVDPDDRTGIMTSSNLDRPATVQPPLINILCAAS